MSKELEFMSWDAFKEDCIVKKNLTCQYTETSGQYDLYGPEGNLLWHTSFLKGPDADNRTVDQIDFENNHKVHFNFPIGAKPAAFATSDYEFMPAMTGPETCPAGGTKSIYLKITENCRLNGGKCVTDGNAVFGDWLSCALVDHDNLLGYGVDTVLKQWVPSWGIDYKSCVDMIVVPYVGTPPAGMWLMYTLHSTGTTPVGFLVNTLLHRPI